MITIIRMQSLEKRENIWNYMMEHKDDLQKSIQGKGQLLYLSKRANLDDISLFIHTADLNILGDFIANQLNKMDDITGLWVINMVKPTFFQIPRDTTNMKRFAISVKVFPKQLARVYESLSKLTLPGDIKMAYLAFTFHLYGDCIQFSVLTENEEFLNKYLTDVVNRIPGVLRTTVTVIEKTKPLVSYDEWLTYSSSRPVATSWNAKHMVDQFQL